MRGTLTKFYVVITLFWIFLSMNTFGMGQQMPLCREQFTANVTIFYFTTIMNRFDVSFQNGKT